MGNDPKREYCSCGYSFTPSTLLKIILLVKGDYVKRCPRCQAEMELHLSHFVYVKRRKDNTDKRIWENA